MKPGSLASKLLGLNMILGGPKLVVRIRNEGSLGKFQILHSSIIVRIMARLTNSWKLPK